MMNLFRGYRTYIIAGLIGVAGVLFAVGIIDEQTYGVAMGILAPGGLAALRAGVSAK